MKKALYISGGYEESQLLWIIIIASSFCESKKINILLFDELPSKKILENPIIKEIFCKHEIIISQNYLPFYYFSKYLRLLRFIKDILFHILFINSKSLLKKKPWNKYQIFHAVWDLALLNSKKNSIKLSIIDKLKASLEVMSKFHFTHCLCKKFKITAFLGHSVYQARAIFTALRENNCDVYVQANYALVKQDKFRDIAWNMPDRDLINKIKLNINKQDVEKYWNLRIEGKGNYEDAVKASLSMNNYDKNFDEYKNVIMLHVFKDSPFNVIDQSRIFSDYIHWIKSTIKIIKESNEKWLLRIHPNASSWGENQNQIIDKLLDRDCNNIIIEKNKISNLELFKKVNRVVTYSGTSHLEAGIFGIKPIVISEVISSKFLENAVFKPKTFQEYKKLLLTSSSSEIFKTTEQNKYSMKELLYIQENILTIKNSINAISIYRGSDTETLNKNFNSIYRNLASNRDYLDLIGFKIANDTTHTISKLLINRF